MTSTATDNIANKVSHCLVAGGDFVFSVEHPIFTAQGAQDWCYDVQGHRLHWPVDRYFEEGTRQAIFLGEEVQKYHKTLTTYLQGLLQAGFEITDVVEPMSPELRRPMMLLVSARKK